MTLLYIPINYEKFTEINDDDFQYPYFYKCYQIIENLKLSQLQYGVTLDNNCLGFPLSQLYLNKKILFKLIQSIDTCCASLFLKLFQ